MSTKARTVHGTPPWDSAPTPPLEVFEAELQRDPELLHRVKGGHLINLLGEALRERERYRIAAERLAEQVAELEVAAEADAERKRVKREYQADYRKGLRGNRAARAAAKAGISA